ncbi:MAG: glycosyltransferase family 4 protein [Candidatus Ratteibacteria bacterium]|jgi:glycosyltransferase involved in cell wall biosynthesis
MKQKRILWVVPYFLFPPNGGTKIILAGIIRHLSGRNQYSLVGLHDKDKDRPPSSGDIAQAERYFQKVRCFARTFPFRGDKVLKLLYALFGPQPLSIAKYSAVSAREEVKEIIKQDGCDLVQANEIYAAQYLAGVEGVKKILVLYNVDSLILWRSFLHSHNPFQKLLSLLQFFKMRRYEKRIIPEFDRCFCISDVDRKTFESIFKERVRFGIISNGVDTKRLLPLPVPEKPDLIFVGNLDYQPNALAVDWFLRQIFPLVRAKVPDAFFFVVGNHPPEWLKRWEKHSPVKFTGYVKSVVEWYRKTKVAVVPLKIGSGTRGKILEAMAYGRPVASTTLGAEGLEVTNDKDILLADRPEEFAGNVVSLLRDSELYARVTVNARRMIEEKYDWKIIAADLEKSYSEILGDTKNSHP